MCYSLYQHFSYTVHVSIIQLSKIYAFVFIRGQIVPENSWALAFQTKCKSSFVWNYFQMQIIQCKCMDVLQDLWYKRIRRLRLWLTGNYQL